jgi:ubiquitin C-terminal hydrolase
LLDDCEDVKVIDYDLSNIIIVEIKYTKGWIFIIDPAYFSLNCKERYDIAEYKDYWESINCRSLDDDFPMLEYEKLKQVIMKEPTIHSEDVKGVEEQVDETPIEMVVEENIEPEKSQIVEVIGNVIKIKLEGLVLRPQVTPVVYKTPTSKISIEQSLVVSTGRRYSGKPSGLINTSNICYLNSSIQLLKGTPAFRSCFEMNGFDSDQEIGSELVKLLDALSAPGTCVSSQKFKKRLDKCTLQFPTNKQCDAHEFLTFLIDKLHDEALKRQATELDKLFYGNFTSTIQCTNCREMSVSYEPFMCISLPIDGDIEESSLILQTAKNQLLYLSLKFDEEEITLRKIKTEIQQTLSLKDIEVYLLVNNDLEVVGDEVTIGQVMSLEKSWRFYGIEKGQDRDMLVRVDIGKTNPPLFLKYPEEVIERDNEFQMKLKELMIKPNIVKGERESAQYNFSLVRGMVHTTQKGLSYLRTELKPVCRNSHYANLLNKIPNSELRFLHQKTAPEDYATLEGCLKCFTGTEKLRGSNQWACGSCHKSSEANKKVNFLQLPQVLMIHLKRFKLKCKKSRIKISKLIQFPFTLELERVDKKVERYTLYGVMNHMGDTERGHYTAFIKSPNWILFDDNKVSFIDEDKVVTENAYVLFYHRINQ